MSTLKVRATVNNLGLSPGEEAEVEVNSQVEAAVSLGHLIVLAEAPVAPAKKSVADKSAEKAKEAPAPVEDDTEAPTDTE